MIILVLIFFLIASSICIGWLIIRKRKINYWLTHALRRQLNGYTRGDRSAPIHVIFCFVDHFEPGNGGVGMVRQRERVDFWIDRYPQLADRHHDADGRRPQHTFFFPPHYDHADHLEKLVSLCARGYGEIEMHMHHDRQEPWPDCGMSLREKIYNCIENFSRFGVFCLPDGRRTYAFIHGDWALANSLDSGLHCGINDELTILSETGCYADFTFPVCNEAQPYLANTFFYGRSSPHYPKGYDHEPQPVMVGGQAPPGCLMIIQGVIGIRWKSRIHYIKPSIEQSNIDLSDAPFPARIDYWIDQHVHVKGRPEWVFVKIHTHGAHEPDQDTLLGKASDQMYNYLEERYNDGKRYKLHYVSARETYNIIKAAEAGKTGDPHLYRDFTIPRYKYLPEVENV